MNLCVRHLKKMSVGAENPYIFAHKISGMQNLHLFRKTYVNMTKLTWRREKLPPPLKN
jgi:hypothetical protein